MFEDKRILILGAGSIGERHIRNLWSLGYRNLFVFRQINRPFRDIADGKVSVLTDWKAVEQMNWFAAFICTPTSQHIDQVLACLQNDMHVFVEKPLSHRLEKIDELKRLINQKNKLVHVAYMMRFHPFMQKVKKYISENTFGRLISFYTHWGSYLPDWHPYEDYHNSYAAKKELGGGAALTLSHDIDLVNWLVGKKMVSCKSELNFSSDLDIDADAAADFLLRYDNGVTGHVHLNYLDKPPRRVYEFILAKATIHIDYFSNTMKITSGENMDILVDEYFERNDLYTDEIKYFFSTIANCPDYKAYDLQQLAESELIIKIATQHELSFS